MNLTPITKHYRVPEGKRDTFLQSTSFFFTWRLKTLFVGTELNAESPKMEVIFNNKKNDY